MQVEQLWYCKNFASQSPTFQNVAASTMSSNLELGGAEMKWKIHGKGRSSSETRNEVVTT